MTPDDETPLDALLGRLNNEESQEELEAERAERAREVAAHAFVKAIFSTDEDTDPAHEETP